jgi:hypothetical protein
MSKKKHEVLPQNEVLSISMISPSQQATPSISSSLESIPSSVSITPSVIPTSVPSQMLSLEETKRIRTKSISTYPTMYSTSPPTTNIDGKTQLLEPISTLIRLIQLAYYPIGTKLSMYNGTIHLQTPSLFQGTIRWKNGDHRNDIHSIYEAIMHIPDHPLFGIPSFVYLLPFATMGLENLVKTYTRENGSELVIHSLQYYISLIQQWIESATHSVQKTQPSMLHQEKDVLPYNKYYSLWMKEELDVIQSILELIRLKHSKGEIYDYLLSMIDSILQGKENILS